MRKLSFNQVVLLVSAIVGLGTLVVAVREYSVKARAEARLQRSTQAETDVKLATAFAQLVPVANGRGPSSALSEKAVSELFRRGEISAADLRTFKLENKLERAVVTYPVGEATQAAAIVAIGELGGRHEFLRRPAFRALEALDFVRASPVLDAALTEARQRVAP